MKFVLGTRLAAFMPILLGLSACGGPTRHETLVKSGRDAETQKQWVQAAVAYQEACDAKPTDAATCKRAMEMREYAVDLRSYNAQQACNANRLAECLTILAPVRQFQTKNRSKVLAVLGRAAALSIQTCLATSQQRENLVPALAELRCLMGHREPLWEAPAFRGHFTERSRAISSQLITRAQLAEGADGARMSYHQAAACLAPLTPEQQSNHDVANASFLSQVQTHFDLQYKAAGSARPAPGTCLEIATKIGRGLGCESRGSAANPKLAVAAEVFSFQPRWKRTYQDRRESVRYKSGTETRNNPAYERARVEYELADGRFRDAERVTSDRESRCLATKEDSDCDAFDSAEDTSDDRKRELDRAQQRFRQEPATITEDVYKDHVYVIRDHRWAAPFRASIRVGAGVSAAELTEVVYTDSEQPGFSEAGIREDAFEAPSQNYFRNESARWLSARLESRVIAELKRRAHQFVDSCKGDRVDCWAVASYWLGTTEFGLPLLEQLSADSSLPPLECSGPLL